MKKRKIGVIGLGSIGARHAMNIEKLGHIAVRYDPKDVGPVALNNVILDSEAFIIASPTDTHCDNFVRCKGKPIFMEKPVAETAAQMAIMSPDMITMVGYNLRFHSCVIKAKEWIDEGRLGTPLWGNFVCGQRNHKYKDSVVLNWSHEIDLALYFLGAGRVTAAAIDPLETIADICIKHENQARSTVHLDYITAHEIRQSLVVGTEAQVIVDLKDRHAWLRGSSGFILDHYEGTDSFDQNYYDEMETFIARIDGQDTIGCTGQEGLDVLRICLEARQLAQ